MKKIIGIGSRIAQEPQFEYHRVTEEYVTAVIQAGAIPKIIPVCVDVEIMEEIMKDVDGIIVTGGDDIDPSLYHQSTHELSNQFNPMMDESDWLILKIAQKKKIPVLGICRGMQMMNIYHGGTLFQDLSLMGEHLNHLQTHEKYKPMHKILIQEGSFLYDILGTEAHVNSYHHQAIDQLADSFHVTAKAMDGVIEAIEDDTQRWIGVQFHPEMAIRHEEKMLAIFKKFIQEVV